MGSVHGGENADQRTSVGTADGALVVGAKLGALEGRADGAALGSALGVHDGALLGADDGNALGCKVGAAEGTNDGVLLGSPLGGAVGAPVGRSVGDADGAGVGGNVGTAVYVISATTPLSRVMFATPGPSARSNVRIALRAFVLRASNAWSEQTVWKGSSV
jgi:hypothetical protein